LARGSRTGRVFCENMKRLWAALGQAGTGTRMREMRGMGMDAYSKSIVRAGLRAVTAALAALWVDH